MVPNTSYYYGAKCAIYSIPIRTKMVGDSYTETTLKEERFRIQR